MSNERIAQLERQVTDLQAVVEILATAIHEQTRPLTYIKPLDDEQGSALEYVVSQLRNVARDESNGELHDVVSFYREKVKRA